MFLLRNNKRKTKEQALSRQELEEVVEGRRDNALSLPGKQLRSRSRPPVSERGGRRGDPERVRYS